MPPAESAAGGKPTRLTGRPAIRNLSHTNDLASTSGWSAARSVLSKGTTANSRPAQDKSGHPTPESWWADLEYVWRMRTAPEVQRLTARARAARRRAAELPEDDPEVCIEDRTLLAQERQSIERSEKWADSRALAMSMSRADVVASCGGRKRKIACGCGVIEIDVGCEQPTLCERCRTRHWRRWRKRIVRTMDAHLRAAVGQWYVDRSGYKPGIYLITFTMPHSGSIISDREAMGRAWHELLKRAGGWWGTFALTWEVTPGTRGDGHVHMHVAAISRWIPYDELRRAWSAVMPGAIQPDVVSPKDARERSQRSGRRYNPAGSAAQYLAKYVTKGVDPEEFSGAKAGELLAAFRGKRKVSTSKHFWRPLRDRDRKCRVCHKEHVHVQSPASLAKHAPGAWLLAIGKRAAPLRPPSWWMPRSQSIQCPLPSG